MMGDPVFNTRCPRTSPSVVSMAIVRTVFSPKCCATSNTTLRLWSCTSNAVKMGGNPFSNFTSTTAPITVAMEPTLPAPVKSADLLSVDISLDSAGAAARAGWSRDRDIPLARPFATALRLAALEEKDLGCCLGAGDDDASLREPARSAAAKALRPDMAARATTRAGGEVGSKLGFGVRDRASSSTNARFFLHPKRRR